MARKLSPMLQWISGEVSRRTKGKKLSAKQRARVFRSVAREGKRKYKAKKKR